MGDVDRDLVERALGWCARAGGRASEEEVRAALAPLGFDELLAVRALLAAPPPARPLGPRALVDVARGAPPEIAAEREREGRYLSESAFERRPRAARRGKAQPPPGPRVRRARDLARPPETRADRRALLDELFREEGRAVLERLVRRHGGRRHAVLAALATGFRRGDGAPPTASDLDALLAAHRLARAFERRERADLLHALRAAGGALGRAAAALGATPEALAEAIRRLGAEAEVEAIREHRRAELRRQATLSERARLVTGEEERLRDLGLLDEFVADLRARLPEHLRALGAPGAGRLAPALGRSLSLSRAALEALARHLGLALGPGPEPRPAPPRRPFRPPDRGRPGRRRSRP